MVPSFGVPDRVEAIPPTIAPLDVPYPNGAKLVGFDATPFAVNEGDLIDATLCWQSEGTVEMMTPFALHVVRQNADGTLGEIVGRRESFTGLGRYTRWDDETLFCDTFILPIDGPLDRGRLYPLVFSTFMQETGFPVARADNGETSTIIGHVKHPAPVIAPTTVENALFRFEGVVLAAYQMDALPGSIQLDFTWGAVTTPGREFRQFIHVYNEYGERMAQLDPIPGGVQYPIWAWSGGERIEDTTMISGLPAGTYEIRTGLYDPETFLRLQAQDANGTPLAEETVVLGCVVVP